MEFPDKYQQGHQSLSPLQTYEDNGFEISPSIY